MFTKIKSLLRQKDYKVLLENFVSLSALQLLNYALPLITLPYLARVLGVEKFGIIAFATASIAYFITLVDFGFNYTGVRDIAKCKDNIDEVSRIFSSIMLARVLLLFIGFIILLILVFTIPVFIKNRLLVMLTFLLVPCYILFPQWFFQAMEKMKYITILNAISRILFTGMIFLVIKDKEDYIYHPILVSLGFLVSGIISLYFIFIEFRIKLVLIPLSKLWYYIKDSWSMFISIFLPNLYTNFSTILLQGIKGDFATGIFDGANKFAFVSSQITNVISRTFYPFLARRIDKHRFYVIVNMGISLFITVILFFGAELIISLFYTDEFVESIIVLKIMAISLFFSAMSNIYGINYLVLIKKDHIYKRIISISSIASFILCFFLIREYSYMGAAYTFLFARFSAGIGSFVCARHFKNKLKSQKIEEF